MSPQRWTLIGLKIAQEIGHKVVIEMFSSPASSSETAASARVEAIGATTVTALFTFAS